MKILTFIAPRIDATYAAHMSARMDGSLQKLASKPHIDNANELGIDSWAALQKHICEAQPRYDFVIIGGDWRLAQISPQNEGFVRHEQPASTSLIALIGEVSAFQYFGLRANGFTAFVDMAEHQLSLPTLIETLAEETQRLRDEITASATQAARTMTATASDQAGDEAASPPPAAKTTPDKSDAPAEASMTELPELPEVLFCGTPLRLSHAARLVLATLVKEGKGNIKTLSLLKVPNLRGRWLRIGRHPLRTHVIPEIQRALTEQKPAQTTAATPVLTVVRDKVFTLLDSDKCLVAKEPAATAPAAPAASAQETASPSVRLDAAPPGGFFLDGQMIRLPPANADILYALWAAKNTAADTGVLTKQTKSQSVLLSGLRAALASALAERGLPPDVVKIEHLGARNGYRLTDPANHLAFVPMVPPTAPAAAVPRPGSAPPPAPGG